MTIGTHSTHALTPSPPFFKCAHARVLPPTRTYPPTDRLPTNPSSLNGLSLSLSLLPPTTIRYILEEENGEEVDFINLQKYLDDGWHPAVKGTGMVTASRVTQRKQWTKAELKPLRIENVTEILPVKPKGHFNLEADMPLEYVAVYVVVNTGGFYVCSTPSMSIRCPLLRPLVEASYGFMFSSISLRFSQVSPLLPHVVSPHCLPPSPSFSPLLPVQPS